MKWALAFLVAAATASSWSPAFACSIFITDHSQTARRERAQWAVDHAAAIIDGEVVRPFVQGQQNALVRAHRVFKGPELEFFEVGAEDSCDIALESVGERRRMLLWGGPDLYFFPIGSQEPKFEDEILGSYRALDWPFRRARK